MKPLNPIVEQQRQLCREIDSTIGSLNVMSGTIFDLLVRAHNAMADHVAHHESQIPRHLKTRVDSKHNQGLLFT